MPVEKKSRHGKEKKAGRKRKKEKEEAKNDMMGGGVKEIEISQAQIRRDVGNYKLGKLLGKGAYGVVFKAISTGGSMAGATVAVKQLYLQSVSSNIAKTLQMEIDLLRGLQHKNIVQYIEHLMVDSTLNIVMEFVENGSLYGMLKEYGNFPEALCKVYIAKTLEGLVYLHAQGVIHRDIKGANILITKDGGVKLADFGVSQNMALNSGEEDMANPMGTPYYMAPEVIQFMGAQPQSDVWSLGCTIIELLKGDPPYFELSSVAAVYKIVNEGVPIPTGITSSLADFLSKCFQRDPALRVSAQELMNHPWLRTGEGEGEGEGGDARGEAKKKIEDHNQRLQALKDEVESVADGANNVEQELDFNQLLNEKDKKEERERKVKKKKKHKQPKQSSPPEEVDPFLNFDDSPSASSLAASLTPPASTSSAPSTGGTGEVPFFDGFDDLELSLANFDGPSSTPATSDPSPSSVPPSGAQTAPGLTTPADNTAPANNIDEVASLQLDLSLALGGGGGEAAFDGFDAIGVEAKGEEEDYGMDFADFGGGGAGLALGGELTLDLGGEGGGGKGDDFFDLGDGDFDLASRLGNDDAAFDFDDDFQTFEEETQEDLLQQQKREEIRREMEDLLDVFVEKQYDEIERASKSLIELFKKHREHISVILSRNILLQFLNLMNENQDCVASILQLIIHIMQDEENKEKILTTFCVMGGISKLRYLSEGDFLDNVRIASAFIIQEICYLPATLQMFVACEGLLTLVRFLNVKIYPLEMNRIGVNGILAFFNLAPQIKIQKMHFFQVLMEQDLLDELGKTMSRMMEQHNSSYLEKCIEIISEFAQGTSSVKQAVCNSSVLGIMLKVFEDPDDEVLVSSILRCVRDLAVADDTILSAVEIFLVPFIRYSNKCIADDTVVQDGHYPVVHTLFYLCFLDQRRQNIAARCGAVAFLKHIIQLNNSLKEFAVPLMCLLVRCKAETRDHLWKEGGLDLYLRLLGDKSWFTDGLQAIGDWCSAKDSRVEEVLQKPENIKKITYVFKQAAQSSIALQVFQNVLDSLLKITSASMEICRSLSSPDLYFVQGISNSLKNNNLYVREKSLRVLFNLFEKHENPWAFISQKDLWEPLNVLAASDPAVVVKNLAKLLIDNAEKKRV